MARLRCFLAGRCDPRRAGPLGGYRCKLCGRSGASLDDFFLGTGYMSPLGKLFTRGKGVEGIERRARW